MSIHQLLLLLARPAHLILEAAPLLPDGEGRIGKAVAQAPGLRAALENVLLGNQDVKLNLMKGLG